MFRNRLFFFSRNIVILLQRTRTIPLRDVEVCLFSKTNILSTRGDLFLSIFLRLLDQSYLLYCIETDFLALFSKTPVFENLSVCTSFNYIAAREIF